MFPTFLFALLKLQFMLLKRRPDVIEFVDEAGTDAKMNFSITENDFMMAFSAKAFLGETKADSRYI